jgi:hypothetical protein
MTLEHEEERNEHYYPGLSLILKFSIAALLASLLS